jgi:hypothetical protein
MSYDIFRAFRKVRLSIQASKQRDEARKLLFYTMYACGAPMIIIILTVVVEYQPPGRVVINQLIDPKIN